MHAQADVKGGQSAGGLPASTSPPSEQGVAAPSRHGLLLWLRDVGHAGWQRLTGLGLALVLGFGAGVSALWLFAQVADGVLERESLRLDTAVLAALRVYSSPVLDRLALGVSTLGSEVVAALLLLLLVWLGRQRRWGAAFSLLITVAGAQMLNNVLKDLFQRTRPAPVTGFISAQAFSFPSGHAMVSVAFYLFVAYLGWHLLRGWRRNAAVAVLLLVIALIGLARLYLGVHYMTDVLAGYLAGFLWTDGVIVAGHLLTRRQRTLRGIRASGHGPPTATSAAS